MNGVTILYTELVEATYSPGWDFWGVVLGILGVACLVITLVFADRLPLNLFPLLGICIVLLIPGSLMRLKNGAIETPEHYEYKVFIDDTVSLDEFNEKYEIIDCEGAIFTIVEKESE